MAQSLRHNGGQSLIEVTFATAVISMVLVGVVSAIVLSLRNSRTALEQTRATQLGQEMLEWARQTRDQNGWGVFASQIAARGSDLTFCIPSLPASLTALLAQTPVACLATDVVPGTAYTRQVRITIPSATQVTVVVQVTRPGRGGTLTTTLQNTLTNWQP
jgi:type II secretory pathway pseudopilin PulG